MAITLVQSRAANNAGAFDGSIALAYTSNVTAGSLLVACVMGTDGTSVSGVSDGVNTWTADKTAAFNTNVNFRTAIYSAPNAAAGATTVTASFTITCRCAIHLFEFAGAATASPADANNDATGNGTNPTLSVTTVGANDLIIGAVNTYDNAWTITAGTNFTLQSNQTTGSMSTGAEYWLDAGAAGAKTVGFTVAGGTGGYWSMAAVAYKIAAAAASSGRVIGGGVGGGVGAVIG